MKILELEEIDIAAECIRNGGLVAFPTETVYGLGANALNPTAVAGIFNAKKRPSFDPLIVHIHDINQLELLFKSPINSAIEKLAKEFWPGPLTIVHKKTDLVPSIVTSDLDAVAVRMPSHPVALELLRRAACPIAAPSANLFGQLSPTSYKHVAKQKMEINYLLKGNDTSVTVGIESTVIAIDDNECTILRPGVITAADIQKCLPMYKINTPGKNVKLVSPGLLQSHYSPLKPLYFLDQDHKQTESAGYIRHRKDENKSYNKNTIFTSLNGNLIEVAANIFSALHQMEENEEVKVIYVEPTSEDGIGKAIMDRLNKATFQYK